MKRDIKIIRIGGTAYSGSTMLDLMLSNADDSFSCGEVYALFRPFRPHHFTAPCSCLDPECAIWQLVKSRGEKELWNTLVHLLPQISIFVDSSKDLVWFRDQISLDNKSHFKSYNVLIWKTPEEYAHSCLKRAKARNWKKSYINYHCRYFKTMRKWISVRYSDLAADPGKKLKKLCNALEINYYPGKELYWKKIYHTLFGSNSAKLHLYERESPKFESLSRERGKHKPMVDVSLEPEVQYHRSINFRQNSLQKLPRIIKEELNDPVISKVHRLLELTELDAADPIPEMGKITKQYTESPLWYALGKFRHRARTIYAKIRMAEAKLLRNISSR